MGPFEQFLLIVVAGATISWVAYVLANVLRRRDQLRAASEIQLKLLERAGSSRELLEVLSSESGVTLMRALASEGEIHPLPRAFRTFQAGVVAVIVGFFVLFYWHEGWWTSGVATSDVSRNTLGAVATVLLGTGVALVIAAGFSYVLARRIGLTGTDRPDADRSPEDGSRRASF
jgi:hypothetical protein